MKCSEFLRLLKRSGARIDKKHGKGGHYLVHLNGNLATVPVHGDTDYDPRFFDDICKQLNTRLQDLS
jgi:predicted RNA binding protein YcfA (HicA-like mRNA interferase family)